MLSGTGNLTKTGSGVLTLMGSNTYTGGTTISAGTLQVGNGTSGEFLGSPTVSISSSAALVFNESDSPTYSGIVSGSGGLMQTGTGLLTLLGSNIYTGGTTISGGTLQVGNGGTLGSITGNVLDNATLAYNLSGNPTFAGVISGSGGLKQLGTGTLTLTASNTYSGATTVSNGTLSLNNANAVQNSTLTVNANNGLLFNSNAGTIATFNAGGLAGSGNVSLADGYPLTLSAGGNGAGTTYSGVLSGTGNLTKTGSGVLTLLGSNSYTGGTTISAGTLQVGNGASGEFLGSPTVSISSSAALVFNEFDSPAYSGIVSGAGGLVQTGTGLLTLLGSNIYTGGTTISGGTLQVGNGGTLGSITGNALDNATLAFYLSGNSTFAGVISGTGGVTQLGTGTLTLTASNGYAGVTTISVGTLQVSGSGVLGTGPVIDNSALFCSTSSASTIAGPISGSGSLTQMGVSVLTLLGSNTYSGVTTISAGTLQVGNGTSGEFLGSLTVNLSNNAALVFNHSDPLTYSGIVSGSGSLTQTGTGLLTLLGYKSIRGRHDHLGRHAAGGQRRHGGRHPGNVFDNGTLACNLPATRSLPASSAARRCHAVGSGKLGPDRFQQLQRRHDHLRRHLRGQRGSGSIAGSGLDNAAAFQPLGHPTFAGAISGTGGVTQAGKGALTLRAATPIGPHDDLRRHATGGRQHHGQRSR